MVGNYQRKTLWQKWNEQSMKNAILAVQRKEMGFRKAAQIFQVPASTLRRRAQNKNKRVNGASKGLGRFTTSLEKDMELELLRHIKDKEAQNCKLTTTDVRRLAYQLAERNKLPHRFNRVKKIAGVDWLKGFRERHKDISLQSHDQEVGPDEATSADAPQAFNKPQVTKFFDILEETLAKEHISLDRIFNADEFKLEYVNEPQIIAEKGKEQVGALTSSERGSHVSIMCCVSSTGHYVPPGILFPRKSLKPELADAAPRGTLAMCQESGWMTGELFLEWIKHFKKHTGASRENKVLLIVGNSRHKALTVLPEFAKQHGIAILCLPLHCTHKLQPLEVSFFEPLSIYFSQEVTKWLKSNPGRTVTQFQVSQLFTPAYAKAATVENAYSGFSKTGICPLNPDIFPEWMFAAAETITIRVGPDDITLDAPGEPQPAADHGQS